MPGLFFLVLRRMIKATEYTNEAVLDQITK